MNPPPDYISNEQQQADNFIPIYDEYTLDELPKTQMISVITERYENIWR